MKLLSRAGVIIGTAIGTVVGGLGYIVLLICTFTLMPIAKSWHMGRLAAEQNFAKAAAGDLMAAYLKVVENQDDESKREQFTEAAGNVAGQYL